ncbi:hypothetical protein C9374_009186 [Naegleria lovaniensis]|uniref:Uncharacterized protein n=1 Tax=Naegleria lovaniensis TaxID=51637 RepID=A0AA88GIF4_NAELO|nr:uncharacterized protein C9374_009186 [Naegleria lovaniensis]KAG2377670.1 hypothetical protein C9374_009186 [Naegleria lovaniensis]
MSSTSDIEKEIKNMTLKEGDNWADSVVIPSSSVTAVDLTEQQHDPNNPLYSEQTTFESMKLKPELLQGIYSTGFKEPSNIQAKTLPIILEQSINLIAQSQSGTGKTACFGLGMLQHVDESIAAPQAICICPTFELATQIHDVVNELGQHTKIKSLLVSKGDRFSGAITHQIVIGTPGKVEELIRRKNIPVSAIKLFVLDEADQMLESQQLKDQAMMIKGALPKQCRVLLFSATYQEEDDGNQGKKEEENSAEKEKKILEFAEKIVPPPVKSILIPKEKLTLKQMKQFAVRCKDEEEKIKLIQNIYETLKIGQSIIFVNQKAYADKLGEILKQRDFTVSVTHANMEIAERKRVLGDFRKGKAKILITTNVFSRGLDISTVTHVINYDLPIMFQEDRTKKQEPDYATYLHRIGRTARFGKKGYAINLVRSRSDEEVLEQIRKYFQTEIEEIDKEDIDEKIK